MTTILHVAAMPFPTRQGTQACIDAMCRACTEAGYQTHLLSYGQGAQEGEHSYAVHGLPSTIGGVRPVDTRSGPSLRKVVSDGRLIRAVRALAMTLRPSHVIAHHVEAALVCQLARVPYRWIAHTDLAAELPSYFARGARVLGRLGHVVDQRCAERAQNVAAVSPLLAEQLSADLTAHVLPTPWHTSPEPVRQDVAEPELIYAGNLDGYQGWEDVVEALAIVAQQGLRPRFTLLTASNPAPWIERAERRGVLGELRIVSNTGESERLFAMRRAQIALVPRRVPGGLPIKLLDHWSLGHAVIASERALAGFSAKPAVFAVADDQPQAFARAIRTLFFDSEQRNAIACAGLAYLAAQHSQGAFLEALERWLPHHHGSRGSVDAG